MNRSKLRNSLFLLVLGLILALSANPFKLNSRVSTRPSTQDKQCQEWQHKEGDKCVDDPGVTHHPPGYTPGREEQCWVECLCREGEYPSNESCAPCSKVGMVCKPL